MPYRSRRLPLCMCILLNFPYLSLSSLSCRSASADASGDFFTLTPLALQSAPIRRAHLHTLFDVRRGYHTPLVALTERADGTTGTVPPQPQPVSIGPAGLLSTASSWFGGLVGQGSVSGDQIDALCMPHLTFALSDEKN